MNDQRRRLGEEGERLAAEYLEREGFRILARGARAGGVEIDLIARRGRLLVFAEVKTRQSRRFGAPEEAVNHQKQARLVRGARAWLSAQDAPRRAGRLRFDVITVEPAGAGAPGDSNPGVLFQGRRLRHLEGAFDAG